MKEVKCSNCGHVLSTYEGAVKLKDGRILDEQCFFDYALDELDAQNKDSHYFAEEEVE